MAVKARTVRIDAWLYVWVKAIAEKERRSFDGQVNWVLERFVKDYRSEHPDFELPEDLRDQAAELSSEEGS